MGILQLNSPAFASFSVSHNLNNTRISTPQTLKPSKFSTLRGKIRAVGTLPDSQSETAASEEPPSVKLAFVSVS